MVILDMNLEVPGEVVDTLTQQGDLHFRRASIRLMNPELLDDFLPVRLSNSHVFSALSLSFFLFVAQIFTIPTRPCKGASKSQWRVVHKFGGHRAVLVSWETSWE